MIESTEIGFPSPSSVSSSASLDRVPHGCGIFPRYGRYPVRKVFRENKGRDKENRVLNDFISLRGDLVENRTPTQLHVQSEYGSFRRAAIPFLSPSLPIPFLPLSPLPD